MFRFIAIALLAAATISLSACAHKEAAPAAPSAPAKHGSKYAK
jgi:hypothetical protein